MPPKQLWPPIADDAKQFLQNDRTFKENLLGPSIDVASEYQSTQPATANDNNHSKTAKTASETRVGIQQPSQFKQIPSDSDMVRETPSSEEKKRKED